MHICLGIMKLKIKSLTQEIHLPREGGLIYDSMQRLLHTVSLIY